jgi:cellulose synthase/poly-beta-1,6-N-acetylglucosamine synthase-like glycosyltransferase
VYNGEKWIRQKLESIRSLDYSRDLIQVIVISDGSTDGTERIASEFSGDGVEVIRVPKGGKALALNEGMQLARGDILFFTDVRQRLEADCLRKLVSCFADPQVGGACGELIILNGATEEEASVGLYWKIEKWIRKQLSNLGTLLVVTGCLYAIRRELAVPLPADALGDDIFLPQAVLRQGYRVVFEDGAKAYDYPTTMDVEFHRKVRTLAGLYQYTKRHGLGKHWFHFFSYKITRLLLPYALVAVAGASLFLPTPFMYAVVGAQVLFYGLALVDSWLPDRNSVKRLSSPARTFCMLMIASVFAASVLFVPAAALWKTTHVRAPKTSLEGNP